MTPQEAQEAQQRVQAHIARTEQIQRDIQATLTWKRRQWIKEMITRVCPEMDLASMDEEKVEELVTQIELELDKKGIV
jgi:hypothetical protein